MTPHRSHRLARLLAAGVAAGALAAPPALARPIDDPQLPVFRDSGTTGAVEPAPAPADAPVVMRHIDAGFDWGSAAIGAGGAGALIVLVSFGGYAYGSRAQMRVAR
jgi:hypothetical protein